MVKKNLLPICAAVLLAMLSWGCHREPIKPDNPGEQLDGEIVSDPIVVDGNEVGYSLSYRSWIVPSEEKSSSNTKGGGNSSQNDTISVILHDTFYHVDTVGYVSINNWDPDKYVQGSYTCHWDRYGLPRSGENNVTVTDSTIVLRVQFEEFSFSYRINFETATYRNGAINIPFPHHSPNVTDLGVEELESLETICRNDSVLARKILQHSIKVVVGNKTYILKAKVLLYRYLPDADPNKFVVRSEIADPLTIAFAPTGDSTYVTLNQVGSTRIIRHYSDNSSDEYVPDLNLDITINGFELAGEDGTSVNPSSCTLTAQDNNGNTLLTFDYGNNIYTWFEVSGLPYITPEVSNNGCVFNINHLLVYDDGYTALYLPDIFCRIDYLETITYTEGPYNVISTHVNVTANGCQPYTVVSRLFIRP